MLVSFFQNYSNTVDRALEMNKIAGALSEDSEQPAHECSLIRVCAVHSMGNRGSKASSGGHRQTLIRLRGYAG